MDNIDVDNLGAPFSNKRKVKNMKVSKSQGTLYIFELLKSIGYIYKDEVMRELEISELTFWRYIQEIRAFIYNFNKGYDLIYDRNEDKYYLTDNK